jgi:hypothetical protein
MNDGKKKVSRFKTVEPVMIYLPKLDADTFRRYAKKTQLTQSQIAKEGIVMRMAGESDPFNQGFNSGLNEAMNIVRNTEGAKMMFPSGKSFAELVCDEIEKFQRGKTND